jgi:hypothetical protein
MLIALEKPERELLRTALIHQIRETASDPAATATIWRPMRLLLAKLSRERPLKLSRLELATARTVTEAMAEEAWPDELQRAVAGLRDKLGAA